jgi:ribonuclease Z
VRSRNNYFPGSETLGENEMRISFVGSCPFPPRRDQAGTCILVELGNGDRFFFDFGPACGKNILAMGVPVQEINDIFVTHLHTLTTTTTCPTCCRSRRGAGAGSSRCG